MRSTSRPSLGIDTGTAECRAEALRILARRERTRRNLVLALTRRFPGEVVKSVVGQLEAEGLVDDRRFGKLLVERAVRFKPQSARSLEARLRKEGCDSETAQKILRDAHAGMDGFDEISLARRLIEKKLRIRGQDRDKILGALARQGFSRTVALEAWAAVARDGDDRLGH